VGAGADGQPLAGVSALLALLASLTHTHVLLLHVRPQRSRRQRQTSLLLLPLPHATTGLTTHAAARCASLSCMVHTVTWLSPSHLCFTTHNPQEQDERGLQGRLSDAGSPCSGVSLRGRQAAAAQHSKDVELGQHSTQQHAQLEPHAAAVQPGAGKRLRRGADRQQLCCWGGSHLLPDPPPAAAAAAAAHECSGQPCWRTILRANARLSGAGFVTYAVTLSIFPGFLAGASGSLNSMRGELGLTQLVARRVHTHS
jgi:hypothetical protein